MSFVFSNQQHERHTRVRYEQMDTPQRLGIVLTGVFAGESNALIRADAGGLIEQTLIRAHRYR